MEKSDLQNSANQILDEVKKQGADAAQIIINYEYNIGTRFGENHITQNMGTTKSTFQLITQIGQRVGRYSGTSIGGNLNEELSDALSLTKLSIPDPDFPGFITEQPHYEPMIGKYIESNPIEIADTIKQIIEFSSKVDTRIDSVAGNLNYIANRSLFLNSYGVEAYNENSVISGVINVAARENGESRSTVRIAAKTIEELNYEYMANKVSTTAINGLNPSEIDPGKYEVILGSSAVVGLMRFIQMAMSAESLINHSSFLKDKVGERVFDERITLKDDTQNPNHLGARRFDSDGIPSPEITYVEDGVIKEYAHNRRTAKKLGVESNGKNASGFMGEMPFFFSTTVKTGNKTDSQLISSIDNGILITNLFYSNFVNPPIGLCTGLTRDGLFRIKNGEIVESLKNMRWTDNLLSIFSSAEPSIDSIQVTGFFGGATIAPSIKVGKFNFSSKGKH